MTDEQTLKLSRIFNGCLLDLEQIGNFDFLSGDREQAMQVLMDTMEAAVFVKENSMQSLDVEISRLEDRVVDAAVTVFESFANEGDRTKQHTDAQLQLITVVGELLKVRKSVEQQNFPLSC